MKEMAKKIVALLIAVMLCLESGFVSHGYKPAYGASTPKVLFITSVTSPKSGCMDIKWKKVSGVTGHHIQISTKSDFPSGKATKSTKSTKLEDHVRITGLKNGSTYYVRVRTYVKSNGSTKYSKWSNKGSAKITSAKNRISLNKTSRSIYVGKSAKLEATVTGSNKSVTWKSSNSSVATVSKGKVVGKKKGSCIITAKANGSAAYCKVTVKEVAVEEVTLNKTSMTLTVGDTGKLTASISPSNASNQSISWSSSNKDVATVSKGTVTAKNAGKVTITAEASNGKTATCQVTVKKPVVAVTDISLNQTSLSMIEGENATLTATISPSNATKKTVSWTSSNTSVAGVNGGTVLAKEAGTAIITAETSNGKTATCKVTVKAATVPVTGISLSKTSLSLTEGETASLTATISPSNASSKSVSWSSSNTNVASVNGGTVLAKEAGTATITAETNNGKTATCTVTVKVATVAVTGISLSKTSLSLTE